MAVRTTPTQRYDVIVVGVGGMGSATVWHLARRGLKVLGLERFGIPHDMGSSHGITRIIRLAYYEHPSYVPLMQRAYELWWDLEKQTGEDLLHITGSIDAGPEDSEVFAGSLRSCTIHHLTHEVLTSAELTQRFPGYRLPAATMAVFQPQGGFLEPEKCIVSSVMAAQALGADVHGQEQVLEWKPLTNGVQVRTDRATYEAAKLVFTAGAWSAKLVDVLAREAIPERQALAWFQPTQPAHFTPDRFPVFNLLVDEGRYYGFPVHGIPGFKIGRYHHLEENVDPDTVDRHTQARDEAVLRLATEKYFPAAAGPTLTLKTCMFTNSKDEHFILDLHPDYPQVSFAAGFSGHGFKFCSVIGEIMADLAQHGDTRHDIAMFRWRRLAGLSWSHPTA